MPNKVPPQIPNWQDYQDFALNDPNLPKKMPILYPVIVGIKDGKIFRERIKTTDLGDITVADDLIQKCSAGAPARFRSRLAKIYQHYHDFFHPHDAAQGGGFVPSPLDFHLKRPVLYMIYLLHDNWAYSGHKQFDVENDEVSNPTIRQKAVFDGMRGILVSNRYKKGKRHKYNLYVTISQTDAGKDLSTDIIIDPGMNTNEGTLPP